MIQKIVKKHRLQERTTTQDDLAYWLSKTPEERVATVVIWFSGISRSAKLQ